MRIYLDYNATAPLRDEVKIWLRSALEQDLYGNASSVHWSGQRARRHLEDARLRIARLGSRKPSEVIFTSGGTEANNLALRGALFSGKLAAKRLLISAVEHPAVLEPARRLAEEGIDLEIIPVDAEGALDLEAFEHALAKPTGLVSVMLVNNETGVLSPIEVIIERAHAHGAKVHVDAVQAAGKVALPISADLITLSGHKLGAPPGVGALLSRESLGLRTEILGGPQERGHRGGTEAFIAAMAMAIALDVAEAARATEVPRLEGLKARLESGLLALGRIEIVGQRGPRVANTTTALFEGISGDALLPALDLAGIMASSGSACSSGSLEPSHVLLAMGMPPNRARSAVRFSTGFLTTPAEVDEALARFPGVLATLRG